MVKPATLMLCILLLGGNKTYHVASAISTCDTTSWVYCKEGYAYTDGTLSTSTGQSCFEECKSSTSTEGCCTHTNLDVNDPYVDACMGFTGNVKCDGSCSGPYHEGGVCEYADIPEVSGPSCVGDEGMYVSSRPRRAHSGTLMSVIIFYSFKPFFSVQVHWLGG